MIKNSIKGLSHEMDLAFDDMYCMAISRPKGIVTPEKSGFDTMV